MIFNLPKKISYTKKEKEKRKIQLAKERNAKKEKEKFVRTTDTLSEKRLLTRNLRGTGKAIIMDTPLQPPKSIKQKIVLDEDMLERERLANIEIEKKKKCVGLLYNKGTYGYIGDAPEEIIKNLGKKV